MNFIILCEEFSLVPIVFTDITVKRPVHEKYLEEYRSLRDNEYSKDGIKELYQAPICGFQKTWHLLIYENDEILAGIRCSRGDIGGLVVREDKWKTSVALKLLLATFALLELTGGDVGTVKATARHNSADILHRIGLVFGYEYYDYYYKCKMHSLYYNSRTPNPKFLRTIQKYAKDLLNSSVIVP